MKPIIEVVERELQVKFEEGVLQACREVGVEVDKERLLQALNDANKFYNEGYREALQENVVLCCDCGHYKNESMWCKFWEGLRVPEHHCGEGERREKE